MVFTATQIAGLLKGEIMMGSPAFEVNKYRKAYINFRNLDSLVQRVDKLEKLNQKSNQ